MAVVKVYDQDKTEAGRTDPDSRSVRGRCEAGDSPPRGARLSSLPNGRALTPTKTRAMVSGGGVKPWQARRAPAALAPVPTVPPSWRGGAILFGPQPRKYDFKVNKKIRKLALRMALSSRLAGDNLLVVKGFDLPEAKTKVFAKIAGNLGLSKALIIAPEESRNLVLSSRNLPGITLTTPDQLSVYEILKHKQLVLLEGAVEPVETRLK